MYVEETSNCCTAKEFTVFPEDEELVDAVFDWNRLPTKKEIIEEIQNCKEDGNAIVVAYLTNKQSKARALLKSVGFVSTRAMSKTHHPETKLYMLHLKLDTWNPPKRKGKVK